MAQDETDDEESEEKEPTLSGQSLFQEPDDEKD